MGKINKLIEKHIKKILLIFIYIQPILDLIAGITQNILKTNITASSIIRLIFLFFCIYYLLILNKSKEKKWTKHRLTISTESARLTLRMR